MPEPAEDVIDHALRDTNIGIRRVSHRLEAGVGEFVDQDLQGYAILQAQRDGRAEGIHDAADRAAFFRLRDEDLAGAAIFVQAHRDVAFVAGDVELMRDGLSRIGQSLATGSSGLFFLTFCFSTFRLGRQRLTEL